MDSGAATKVYDKGGERVVTIMTTRAMRDTVPPFLAIFLAAVESSKP